MIFNHLFYILKLLRPRQWIKNIALFAAIVFSGNLFNVDIFLNVFVGFIAFTLLSSSTYILNDILDVDKDRQHPFKKARPIASGKISIPEALLIFLAVITVSFMLALKLGGMFFLIWLTYIMLQISYSFIFKNVAMFDILFIASGYILRVLAGEVLSSYHISAWLLLTTVSLSLFLAVGKRRSELTLLRKFSGDKIEVVRKSLSHYSESLLDAFTSIFATSTFVFYSMFTFLENPTGIKITLSLLLPDFLPYYLQRKWLMVTILPVIYGLMRYMQDIYEKSEGESPERVLLSDKALLGAVMVWIFLVIFVIYFIS
jgi:decaprenyl-phosphate phosphoribosyltransferase